MEQDINAYVINLKSSIYVHMYMYIYVGTYMYINCALTIVISRFTKSTTLYMEITLICYFRYFSKTVLSITSIRISKKSLHKQY